MLIRDSATALPRRRIPALYGRSGNMARWRHSREPKCTAAARAVVAAAIESRMPEGGDHRRVVLAVRWGLRRGVGCMAPQSAGDGGERFVGVTGVGLRGAAAGLERMDFIPADCKRLAGLYSMLRTIVEYIRRIYLVDRPLS